MAPFTPAADPSDAAEGLKIVLSTCPPDAADGLARALVGERLAACCNQVPGLQSVYWWEGQLQSDAETLLILKTPESRVAALLARLEVLHPYDVPEMLVLPVESGFEPYLAWARRTVMGA